jgi:hypothetical protein
MNTQNFHNRAKWNIIIALGVVVTIAIFAVGVAYAEPSSPTHIGEWGDLPAGTVGYGVDGYGFIVYVNTGAVHDPYGSELGLHLGQEKDFEDYPIESVNADGDDTNNIADEDGITRDMTQSWTNEAFVDLIVEVNGCADNADCYLNGWIDWNRDFDFEDPDDQIFFEQTVQNGLNTLTIQVPAMENYLVGDDVYAHFRLCSSTGPTPNGCNELGGEANDGEVEDYFWEFGPTAVELVSIEATTNYAVPFALLAGALILLFSGGAILAFKRKQA